MNNEVIDSLADPGIGLLFALILLRFSPLNTSSGFVLPLLAGLLMSELGFILTAIGTGMGVHEVLKQGGKTTTCRIIDW